MVVLPVLGIRPRRLALLLVVALASAGCALPLRRTCLDGWPIKILQDPQCPRGICGYTCAPDRWRVGDSAAGAIGDPDAEDLEREDAAEDDGQHDFTGVHHRALTTAE
jgi:hypothetical protein